MSKRVVDFKVGKNKYQLRFGTNMLVELESLSGKPFQEMFETPDFKTFQQLIFAGLKYGSHPEITIIDAGNIFDDLLDTYGIEKVSEDLMKGLDSIMGKAPISSPNK